MRTQFVPVVESLQDLLGGEYVEAVGRGNAFLRPGDHEAGLGQEKVEFLPEAFVRRQEELLSSVGRRVIEPATATATGATTAPFARATDKAKAPLSGLGMYRLGEDGRLFIITKGEHYHVSLGHRFPGMGLLERARKLGIPNATHNNTRGHITRVLEEQMVAAANGVDRGAVARLHTLNRVLNLETGSLACEAAIKLALARFYRVQGDSPEPKYAGKTPVMLVLADADGGITANYHGTTVVAQTMRGMWQEIGKAEEKANIYKVRAIRPSDIAGLEAAFKQFESSNDKIAAMFMELILMNYGGILIEPAFARAVSKLCQQHDVPLCVDEIQTGIWSPKLLMYREYGMEPAMVTVGKGFPAGEYPASRLVFSEDLDVMPQFGALVTNGQEELASLAYLIAMRWAAANAEVTAAVGEYFETKVREVAGRHGSVIKGIEGRRHLLGIHFHSLPVAKAFIKSTEELGMDLSVQTYKSNARPAALTKLPLIATHAIVDFVIDRMAAALETVQQGEK